MKYLIGIVWALVLANAALSVSARRIYNGNSATQNQLAYVAYVIPYFSVGGLRCTASILSNEWVLTAAHCLYYEDKPPFYATVCVGYVDANSKGLCNYATQMIVHPNYDKKILKNDVALVKMPYVQFTTNIKYIPLPSSQASDVYDDQTVLTAGWGATSDGSGLANVLQWTTLKAISNEACRQRFEGTGIVISDQQICVDASTAGICGGDSGGPLISTQFRLIGVTSFKTEKNCSTGRPVVFTRTSSCLGWIYENTGISY